MRVSEWRDSDYDAAAECPIFKGCTKEDVRAFLSRADAGILSFGGGEVIPAEARAECWGIVLQGSVRLYSGSDGGGKLLINVVGSSQPFDIAALAGCGAPVMSEAHAVGRSRVAFVRVMPLPLLMTDYPLIASNCMAFLCGRIGFLNRKLRTLSRGTAEQKLADYLLGEFTNEDGRAVVRVKSCVELAVRLSLSRASLYRAFAILEDACCISRRGKEIELLDIAALQGV